jgi:hypothetical protein
VVVSYFNICGITVIPNEADSPLIVDPDTVLPFSIAFQHLQPIRRWYPQIDH